MGIFQSGGSQVGSAQITDNSIVNADINSAAAIARTKLANPLLLKVRKSSNQTLGAMAVVTFDTEVTDVDNAFASNLYTSPRAQTVKIIANLQISNAESTVRSLLAELRLNGAAIRTQGACTNGENPGQSGITIVETVTLAQNDTIDLRASSTGTSQAVVSGAAFSSLTIESA